MIFYRVIDQVYENLFHEGNVALNRKIVSGEINVCIMLPDDRCQFS